MSPANSTALQNKLESSNRSQLMWLLPLFIGSGCAALVYEIVWLQSLQLIVGASAISLGVLLATFMGGMCIGSLLFPSIIPLRWHPLRVYAALEIGIGITAVLIWLLLPRVETAYLIFFTEGHTTGVGSVLLRAVIAGVCLLPPTVLMGATLPAISRWYESSSTGALHTGLFYTANIVGAVFGCLLASFYLLRLFDVTVGTFAAAGLNAMVALIGWIAASRLPYARVPENAGVPDSARSSLDESLSPTDTQENLRSSAETEPKSFSTLIYCVAAVSGMTSLGAEVVWTRELSLMLGASVYTFSLILAVFLVALALGSGFGSFWLARLSNPALGLVTMQLCASAGILWAAWITAESLPYWPIDLSLSVSPWINFQLDIVRVAWVAFPSAFAWGGSFPLALAAVAAGRDPARFVGKVYATNTFGAILGAVGVGWFAIPWIGITGTHQFLVLCLVVASGALLVGVGKARGHRVGLSTLCLTGFGVLLAAVTFSLPAPPAGLVGYGRYWITWMPSAPKFLYWKDGLSSSIAVSEFDDGTRCFHVSGKVVASSEPQDMRVQLMLGHLPALMVDEPKSALIVGCGAGVTAGTFVLHPSIERIVICEIEPLIPSAAGKYFREQNNSIMQDPRLEIIHDDARHFMLTTNEKFDVITSDPIHPWVKGAAALYSQEYFELCSERLKPGGVAVQWIPLYESSSEAVKSEIATFFAAFEQSNLWMNDAVEGGYDLIAIGHNEVKPLDLVRLESLLNSPQLQPVRRKLETAKLSTVREIAKTYGGDPRSLKKWLKDATINRDRNLRLQYSAGWAMNAYAEQEIRNEIEACVQFPDGYFVGSKGQLDALRTWFVDRTSSTDELKPQ